MNETMTIDSQFLQELIRTCAREELLTRFQQVNARKKADGSLITDADLMTQQRIREALAERYPQIPFLGEEMSAQEHRSLLTSSDTGLWCLDPLDGTANFVAGMPCFGLSLAYMRDGRSEIGIIYDPVRDECFHARRGEGAWLNDQPLRLATTVTALADCVAMVDFKRLPKTLAAQLASSAPYRSQRSIGSVALDWCWLAAGRLQLYLHGGQRLWDYAAGTLIFAEAGGTWRLTEHYGQIEPGAVDVEPRIATAAANPQLFELWLDWIEQNR
jgi:myo-inositol-1(or 4)-monophosphatase